MNKIFAQRRQHLMNELGSGMVIIPTTQEIIRSQDLMFKFRHDSYFYYLTNFSEPNAIMILDIDNNKQIIFCREKNIERETWDGFRYGTDAVLAQFGFDEAYNIDDFPNLVSNYLTNVSDLYYTVAYMPFVDKHVLAGLEYVRKSSKPGIFAPQRIIDINQIIATKRRVKDEFDIEQMKTSCAISALGHVAAMKSIKTSVSEGEIEGIITAEFLKHGASGHSYSPIVGGGRNSCILHYNDNNKPLVSGELLLIDAGAEFNGYAGDITRTIPINGKFSQAQREIYEIVLDANKQSIELVTPGIAVNKPKEKSIEVITAGLVRLGLLNGNVDDLISSGAYRRFYMHGVGHWLGLDVHDVGSYTDLEGNWLEFTAGMIMTIEPGIYITQSDDIPEKYWNIGVRIEDDILVTATGNYDLSGGIVKEIHDVENLINT